MTSAVMLQPLDPHGSHDFSQTTSRGEDRKIRKLKRSTSRLLGCPYRKRHPLGFNIRDAHQCCGGFVTVSEVIDHIYSFHGRRKDEVPHLYRKPGCSEAEAWSVVYQTIFHDSENPPSPYHCKVVEHLEYYRIQNSCLVMFADHLQETIDAQQLKLDPVDYIMETLQKFVNVTFHFATQYGLDLLEAPIDSKQESAGNFGKFVKTEEKQEKITKPGRDPRSGLKDSSKPKMEGVAVKKDPEETRQHDWKNVVGVTQACNISEPNSSDKSSSWEALEIIDLTDSVLSAPLTDNSLQTKPKEPRPQEPLPPPQVSCVSPSDAREDDLHSTQDDVPERQLCEILNYTCHSVLGADFDTVANSRLLYDTLIDLAEDFVVDLAEAAASCNEAAGSGGRTGDSSPHPNTPSFSSGSGHLTFPSSRGRSGNQNNQRDSGDGGDNRIGSSQNPPASSRGRKREIRLPCPFRMMFPRVFNVRSHYSCSMTYFPTIGRLKDHLREYHKRQDGAEVLCPRCFAGFKSRDELHRHSRAIPVCDPSDYDATFGLHGEAINLLRGRDRAGQDYREQWKDICKIVFQNDQTLPMAEYHAVMEHFEFADVFLQFFGELARHLDPATSREGEEAANNFGIRAAESLFGWYHLGLDNCQPWSQIAESIPSGNGQSKEFEVLTVYCIKTLQRLAEISWDTRYENDGSRGNGGKRPRRRDPAPELDRLPTPAPSHGPSSVPNDSPVVLPNNEGERAPKRRRLAPVPAPAISTALASPREDTSSSLRQLRTPTGTSPSHLQPLTPYLGHPGRAPFPEQLQSPPSFGTAAESTNAAHVGTSAHLLNTGMDDLLGHDNFTEPWDGTYCQWTQDIPDFLTKLDRQGTPTD
ncbi:hypothetical protein QBC34DRAFT_490038 [Podospora aff. communis PSN243]|uniref:C2H2-type domain-containing protein n=1 Tax=Podospora aff. communis PSN243 TaxID=3040156 RepID=A0AAV9H5V3_9PEZI|nr:hypothetical protein QBC34DRAFT_490038 [Podospora aff. communis PSN243]